ncbi:MAG: acylneuraminate cytidylyltransferase family protein [Anaerolineaceae bacterium]|nr:MAG: acylneuraminate cytidylyltransferase family protein [Anaerolineaceae bacterium]
MSNYVVGVIFARGGSKGIPRKNLRLLAGKPLIAYAINTALASNLINRVVVSTDDREIAAVAQEYGAEIPFMRPEELAQDDSPEWLAWQHAIRELKLVGSSPKRNIFVCIPPTSPLRAVENVDACIQELLETDADLVITVKPADRNPYFNMVMLDAEGWAHLVIPMNKEFHHRQTAPQVYDMTTVAYAARPEFVLQTKSMFEGKVRTVVVPLEQAVDIDSELDLKFAEFLLSKSS